MEKRERGENLELMVTQGLRDSLEHKEVKDNVG